MERGHPCPPAWAARSSRLNCKAWPVRGARSDGQDVRAPSLLAIHRTRISDDVSFREAHHLSKQFRRVRAKESHPTHLKIAAGFRGNVFLKPPRHIRMHHATHV